MGVSLDNKNKYIQLVKSLIKIGKIFLRIKLTSIHNLLLDGTVRTTRQSERTAVNPNT